MEKIELKCHCGKSATFENPMKGAFNVGEAVNQTGFLYVILNDGDSTWLCPTCATKAKQLAKELLEVVGTDQFYFRSFLQ